MDSVSRTIATVQPVVIRPSAPWPHTVGESRKTLSFIRFLLVPMKNQRWVGAALALLLLAVLLPSAEARTPVCLSAAWVVPIPSVC